MKNCLTIMLLLFTALAVASQPPAVSPTGIERVQKMTEAVFKDHEKARILLTDLTEVICYVDRLDADGFAVSADKKGQHRATISYADVLAISSSKGSVSLIPDPKTAPFGSWTELKKLNPN